MVSEWKFSDFLLIAGLGILAALLRRTIADTGQQMSNGAQWMRREKLHAGVKGTEQTLCAMADLIRRDARRLDVRDFAARIIDGCKGHDFECEITRVFYYVRDMVKYRRDPVEVERLQDTPRTLHRYGSGDCDDKVIALGGLLGSLGHKSRLCVLSYDGRQYGHVYLEVSIRGEWVPVDPTNEQAELGWEAAAHSKATYPIFQ